MSSPQVVPDSATASTQLAEEKQADKSSCSTDLDTDKATSVDYKACLVCGDRALGYNFNALSCESCKAFFRRNAFKDVFGRCDSKCEITVETRSYCKRCRIQKCFKVGMNRNLILNSKQRGKRSKNTNCKDVSFGVPQVGSTTDGIEPTTSNISSTIQKTQEIHSQVPITIKSSPSPPVSHKPLPQLAKCLKETKNNPGTTQAGSKNDHVQIDIRDGSYIEVIEYMYQLPENIRVVVRQLAQAFYDALESEPPKPMNEKPSQSEFINMADQWVRRLVKLNKKIDDFSHLSQEDQIALLKGCMVELLTMLSSTTFDVVTKTWTIVHKESSHKISSENLINNKPNDMYTMFLGTYVDFMVAFVKTLCGDRILLMLTVMLSVFAPDRPNIKGRDVVDNLQYKYALILHDYIAFKYPRNSHLFARLIMKLTEIRTINESHSKALENMEFNTLEPLCAEIYDLKPTKSKEV